MLDAHILYMELRDKLIFNTLDFLILSISFYLKILTIQYKNYQCCRLFFILRLKSLNYKLKVNQFKYTMFQIAELFLQ